MRRAHLSRAILARGFLKGDRNCRKTFDLNVSNASDQCRESCYEQFLNIAPSELISNSMEFCRVRISFVILDGDHFRNIVEQSTEGRLSCARQCSSQPNPPVESTI